MEVTKYTPDYTIPTNLTATYGDTLADVTFPNGFTFDDVATTSVGNVGNNIFKVTFTPDDEVNYNKVENLEVTIKVEKAEDDKKPVVDDKPTTDDKNPTVDDTENPKTDANSNFAFFSILALISVAGACGVKKMIKILFNYIDIIKS